MLKQTNIANVINPVDRIMPVLAVDSIGSIAQELGDRATQFSRGQEYFAHVLSKVSDNTYKVRVEGGNVKGVVLKMELGADARTGQTLQLRYMHDNPALTFLLVSALGKNAESPIAISPAAHMIGHYLEDAENKGVSTRYDAIATVTHNPKNPQEMAHDLKSTVSHSGLFYESHLSKLIQGNQTLSAIMQEPQNQAGTSLPALISQQLAVLENQHMAWHGEIWPGQKMDWDIYLRESTAEGDTNQSMFGQPHDVKAVFSEVAVYLPNLGKVSMKLVLINGHMRVNIQAEQAQAVSVLKSHSVGLVDAFVKNGQQLDALTVMQYG